MPIGRRDSDVVKRDEHGAGEGLLVASFDDRTLVGRDSLPISILARLGETGNRAGKNTPVRRGFRVFAVFHRGRKKVRRTRTHMAGFLRTVFSMSRRIFSAAGNSLSTIA